MNTRALVLAINSVDNAAFDLGQRHSEIARIINSAANDIQNQAHPLSDSTILRDTNGNKVGYTKIMPADAKDSEADAFRISIDLANDAFTDSEPEEVARILNVAAKKVESGTMNFALQDINGNTVGNVIFADAADESQIDLGKALRTGRVYFADDSYSGIADGEFRYVVTHPDTPVGYHMDEIDVWLVNAAGEVSGDLQSVKENSLTELKRQDIELLEKVIRKEISLEEHELNFQEEDDSPAM